MWQHPEHKSRSTPQLRYPVVYSKRRGEEKRSSLYTQNLQSISDCSLVSGLPMVYRQWHQAEEWTYMDLDIG